MLCAGLLTPHLSCEYRIFPRTGRPPVVRGAGSETRAQLFIASTFFLPASPSPTLPLFLKRRERTRFVCQGKEG